jgi:hypothetical protein
MKGSSLRMTSALRRGVLVSLGLVSLVPARAGTSILELKTQYGEKLQVLGQVQQIDFFTGTLLIAGQHISISRQTAFLVDHTEAATPIGELQAIKPGDVLAIFGAVGSPAATIDRLSADYISGATTIYVKGTVTAVDKAVGVARIGELGVDFTPAMSDPELSSLAVGQVVEAVGIQTSASARMLAEHMLINGPSAVKPTSISGTSMVKPTSISGTSVVKPDSISGTSVLKPSSISGTSVVKPDSISGTSMVKPTSISGTSVVKPDSISGTSVLKPSSISGTSVVKPDSISGTSIVKPTSISGSTSVAKPASISGTS